MPQENRERRERAARVSCLFGEMLDSPNPEAILALEKDIVVQQEVRELWLYHVSALRKEFLHSPVELVVKDIEPQQRQFTIGQVLNGRFAVQELLGSGGMGEVYRAADVELDGIVALKTIRASLAARAEVRRRFIAEIQNARRVTHPHVCRINDLFSANGIPFFSMQWLDGQSLAEWFAPGLLASGIRRKIAIQLADALTAAHQNGVLHCDFKPSNIILVGQAPDLHAYITDFGLARAVGISAPDAVEASNGAASFQGGTLSYMAPELLQGDPPSVRTDLYSFGVVLKELLPRSRLAARCISPDPKHRPESMSRVLDALQRKTTRRVTLGTLLATPVALAAFLRWNSPKPVRLPARKVAVTEFRPDQFNQAAQLRNLLIMALQQSPIFSVIPDEQLRALFDAAKDTEKVALDLAGLRAIARKGDIGLILDGMVSRSYQGMGLSIEAVEPDQNSVVADVVEHEASSARLTQLADRAAFALRQNLGESESSLQALYTPLDQVTSASPEAVDLYFRALAQYDTPDAEAAETLFEEAIKIDSQFALAHLRLGMARANGPHLATCVECYEHAFQLRNRLPDREKLFIESRYYNIIGNWEKSLRCSKELVAHYPGEAEFHRQWAFAFARLGQAEDAVRQSKLAVELDSRSIHNQSQLIVNLAAANRPQEALESFSRAQKVRSDPLLRVGAALAYVLAGDFAAALQECEIYGAKHELAQESSLMRCAPLVLTGRFAEAQSALIADLTYDDEKQQTNTSEKRRYWLGWVSLLSDDHATAHGCATGFARLTPTPVYLEEMRQGALLAIQSGNADALVVILEGLRSIERRWSSTRASGILKHVESQAVAITNPQDSARLLNEASGLWLDPPTLYSMATQKMLSNEFPLALRFLAEIEDRRGWVLNEYFAGLLVQGRIQRAKCLAKMSRFEESRRLYKQVLNTWRTNASGYTIVSDLESEYRRLGERTN